MAPFLLYAQPAGGKFEGLAAVELFIENLVTCFPLSVTTCNMGMLLYCMSVRHNPRDMSKFIRWLKPDVPMIEFRWKTWRRPHVAYLWNRGHFAVDNWRLGEADFSSEVLMVCSVALRDLELRTSLEVSTRVPNHPSLSSTVVVLLLEPFRRPMSANIITHFK